MKVKKGQIIFLVVIFLIIVSKINCVFADSVQVRDLVKDEYYDTYDTMMASYSLEDFKGQMEDSNFWDYYKFTFYGVDIDRVKEYGQEDGYKNLINAVLDKMVQMQSAKTLGLVGGSEIKKDFKAQGLNYDDEKKNVQKVLNAVGASSTTKEDADKVFGTVDNLDKASKSTDVQTKVDAVAEATKAQEERQTTIYQQPTVATDKSSGSTLEDMMTDADNFVKSGDNDKVKSSDLQNLSGIIYNIALQIGIGVAVIAGLALGIQFMLSSVEGKADVKKGLKVYAIGCVVVFGSFGIWKLVVTLMQQI